MVTFNVPSVIFGLERIAPPHQQDRKSTRLNSSHLVISYAVFCLKKKIVFARTASNDTQICMIEANDVGDDDAAHTRTLVDSSHLGTSYHVFCYTTLKLVSNDGLP